MTRQTISTEVIDATTRCFELYGADPARWPAAERDAYGAFADADELAAARADAMALDGFLGAATAPRMGTDLPLNVMADFDACQAQGAKAGSFGFNGFLSGLFSPPRFAVGAFAAAAVLGVASGVISAGGAGVVSPETEAYAYLMDASLVLFDETEISQ